MLLHKEATLSNEKTALWTEMSAVWTEVAALWNDVAALGNAVAAHLTLSALWQASGLDESAPLKQRVADPDGWVAPSN